jgi:predicted SnoaL-like aldol condensation-catalyzing enzyme
MRVVAEDILADGDKVAVHSSVEGTGTPDRDAQPTLIEIFRIDNGRLAEMRGITEGRVSANPPPTTRTAYRPYLPAR